MIIDDFNIPCITIYPYKANAPLVINWTEPLTETKS